MELAFDSKKLRDLCEDEFQAQQEFDITVARALKHRLADLRAAKSIEDLLVGKVRSSGDVDDKCKRIDLRAEWYLVFCANHPRNPTTTEGRLDWSRVGRIKIVQIGNVHDEHS